MNILDGGELWQSPLPYASQATPMSYLSPQGKQTVVVTVPVHNSNKAVGFGVIAAEDEDPAGGYIIAYRLPD
jgi:glucose dehydrogenase